MDLHTSAHLRGRTHVTCFATVVVPCLRTQCFKPSTGNGSKRLGASRDAGASDGRHAHARAGRPHLALPALAGGRVCGNGGRAQRRAAVPAAGRQHGRRRVQELARRAGAHLAQPRAGAARRVQGPGDPLARPAGHQTRARGTKVMSAGHADTPVFRAPAASPGRRLHQISTGSMRGDMESKLRIRELICAWRTENGARTAATLNSLPA